MKMKKTANKKYFDFLFGKKKKKRPFIILDHTSKCTSF